MAKKRTRRRRPTVSKGGKSGEGISLFGAILEAPKVVVGKVPALESVGVTQNLVASTIPPTPEKLGTMQRRIPVIAKGFEFRGKGVEAAKRTKDLALSLIECEKTSNWEDALVYIDELEALSGKTDDTFLRRIAYLIELGDESVFDILVPLWEAGEKKLDIPRRLYLTAFSFKRYDIAIRVINSILGDDLAEMVELELDEEPIKLALAAKAEEINIDYGINEDCEFLSPDGKLNYGVSVAVGSALMWAISLRLLLNMAIIESTDPEAEFLVAENETMYIRRDVLQEVVPLMFTPRFDGIRVRFMVEELKAFRDYELNQGRKRVRGSHDLVKGNLKDESLFVEYSKRLRSIGAFEDLYNFEDKVLEAGLISKFRFLNSKIRTVLDDPGVRAEGIPALVRDLFELNVGDAKGPVKNYLNELVQSDAELEALAVLVIGREFGEFSEPEYTRMLLDYRLKLSELDGIAVEVLDLMDAEPESQEELSRFYIPRLQEPSESQELLQMIHGACERGAIVDVEPKIPAGCVIPLLAFGSYLDGLVEEELLTGDQRFVFMVNEILTRGPKLNEYPFSKLEEIILAACERKSLDSDSFVRLTELYLRRSEMTDVESHLDYCMTEELIGEEQLNALIGALYADGVLSESAFLEIAYRLVQFGSSASCVTPTDCKNEILRSFPSLQLSSETILWFLLTKFMLSYRRHVIGLQELSPLEEEMQDDPNFLYFKITLLLKLGVSEDIPELAKRLKVVLQGDYSKIKRGYLSQEFFDYIDNEIALEDFAYHSVGVTANPDAKVPQAYYMAINILRACLGLYDEALEDVLSQYHVITENDEFQVDSLNTDVFMLILALYRLKGDRVETQEEADSISEIMSDLSEQFEEMTENDPRVLERLERIWVEENTNIFGYLGLKKSKK